jgi:hypothetical protein
MYWSNCVVLLSCCDVSCYLTKCMLFIILVHFLIVLFGIIYHFPFQGRLNFFVFSVVEYFSPANGVGLC